MSEWIKCTERMPEVWGTVLVATLSPGKVLGERIFGGCIVAYLHRYSEGGRLAFRSQESGGEQRVTHWMPLPDPPKVTE